MASGPSTSKPRINVGHNTIDLPDTAGRRAREWALALAADAESRHHPEAADELASPRMVLWLEAVITDERQRVLLAVEQAIVKEL